MGEPKSGKASARPQDAPLENVRRIVLGANENILFTADAGLSSLPVAVATPILGTAQFSKKHDEVDVSCAEGPVGTPGKVQPLCEMPLGVEVSHGVPQCRKQNIVQTLDTQVKTGIVDKVMEVSKENVFPVTEAVHKY